MERDDHVGCEIFLKGYQWRIGNGVNIYIHKDPWLEGDRGRKSLFALRTIWLQRGSPF